MHSKSNFFLSLSISVWLRFEQCKAEHRYWQSSFWLREILQLCCCWATDLLLLKLRPLLESRLGAAAHLDLKGHTQKLFKIITSMNSSIYSFLYFKTKYIMRVSSLSVQKCLSFTKKNSGYVLFSFFPPYHIKKNKKKTKKKNKWFQLSVSFKRSGSIKAMRSEVFSPTLNTVIKTAGDRRTQH